jgi:serine/threonine-protein kinase HipA
VIWRETGEKGLIEFVRRFVFNALIGNGDMHLKNWSLIYTEPMKAALAPAYDFVSTIPYISKETLALNFVDSKDFRSLNLDQFQRFADKGHFPEKLIMNTVKETVQAFSEAWRTIDNLPLENRLKELIISHLKTIPLWTQLTF